MRVFEASCCVCLHDAAPLENRAMRRERCHRNRARGRGDVSDVSGGSAVKTNCEQPHEHGAGGAFRRNVINVSLKKQRETFLPPFPSVRPLLDAPFLWFARGHMQPVERSGWPVIMSPFQVSPFPPPLPPDLFEAQVPSSSLPAIYPSPPSSRRSPFINIAIISNPGVSLQKK